MPLTSQQLKAKTDLARKQTTKGLTPTKFQTGTTVTKTGFADKIKSDAEANAARIEKKRQACVAKGGTFDPVRETCSMGITEELGVSESFRGQRVSKEQEALNLIARGDIEQVETGDTSGFSETTLATLAGAKKQEEEKTELERKLEKAKLDAEKKRKLKEKALEAAAPGVEVGVEAPTLALARGVEGILTEKAAIIEEDFAVNQQAITDAQTELDEALRTGRVDLVKQARASMLDLRKQELNLKAQATSDVIETLGDTLLGKSEDELAQIALDQNVDLGLLKLQQEKLQLKDKTAEQAAKIASTKTSQTNIRTLAENGGILAYNTDQLLELDKSAGYAPGTSALIAQRAREVQEADKADKEDAQRKMDAQINEINSRTQQNLSEIETDINFGGTQTALKAGMMESAKGKGIDVLPSIPGSETSKIGDGNIILGSSWVWGLDIDGAGEQEFNAPSAIDGGIIVAAEENGEFGNQITIEKNGLQWTFNHMSNTDFDNIQSLIGQEVNTGDFLGRIGNTGAVDPKPDPGDLESGSHLDVTVYKNGKPIEAQKVEALINSSGVQSGEKENVYNSFIKLAQKNGLTGKKAIKFADNRFEETFKGLTEAQGKAFNAFVVMEAEDKLFDKIITGVSDSEDFADAINIISEKIKDRESPMTAQLVNNLIKDPAVRSAIMSEVRWIEGALREESGAAINVGEYLNKGGSNFPRSGDDKTEIENKKAARERATKAKFIKMGPSGQRQWEEVFGEEAIKEVEKNKDRNEYSYGNDAGAARKKYNY